MAGLLGGGFSSPNMLDPLQMGQMMSQMANHPGLMYSQSPENDPQLKALLNQYAPQGQYQGKMGFSAPGGAAVPDTYAAPSSLGAAGGGTTGSAPGSGGTFDNSFVNQYYAADPAAALNHFLSGAGMGAGDVNSPFYNFLNQLAPGAQWLSMLGSPDAFKSADSYMNSFDNYFGGGFGGAASGAAGGFGGALSTLLGGGTDGSALAGYIDTLKPNEMMNAIKAMAMSSSMGDMTPWAMQGMDTQLSNLLNQFNASGAAALTDPMVTAADALRGFLTGTGSNVMSALFG